MDEVDWENSGMFNRFGTDVVVDEVTLTRRDPADRSSGKDGPVGLNHSVALLRLDHSPSSSPQADESPLLSPSQMRGDLSMPSVSPPWMPDTKSPRIDKPAAYDGMPSSEANSSFFPDFHSSSIFGGEIVKAPSPIETPELCPSSTTPNAGLDSGNIPTTHSHSSSSSTDSHLNQTSPPPSLPTLPLLQSSSIGPSSSASPVSCPIPTTTAPPLAKRFLSGFSFGGINKVFKHSTKEAGAGHGFF
ncbi:hypothetical protein [Phaffia rhodozyma]|uniref:Uncharacterized protein n=1 Tax=Phaffia rhodozyma TaxID=264483 RepID=A0A0F7SV78_PHARH|nr:hypothetical protein [Phaffia rhodozyma]